MTLGYTINGAKQLGIEDKKGSITAGKDADFLVFDNDPEGKNHGQCNCTKDEICGVMVRLNKEASGSAYSESYGLDIIAARK